MRRKLSIAFAAVVTFACVALVAQERRSVVLEIGLPNGSTPQLRILEGGTGTVDMPKVGKFGFVPTLKDDAVSVEVFDLSQTPHRQVDRVDATIGGGAVQSNGKPQFSIRVVRLVAH
jgi:hypothetical protein